MKKRPPPPCSTTSLEPAYLEDPAWKEILLFCIQSLIARLESTEITETTNSWIEE